MRTLRVLLKSALVLCILLGLAIGGLALMGRVRWGDAAWYYHTVLLRLVGRENPDYKLRCGQQALRRGNVERVDQIALLLEADGDRDRASLLRGERLFREGKDYADAQIVPLAKPLLEKAETELNKIRDKGDIRLEAAALLGQCYMYLKRFGEAKRAFDFVLANRPDHIDAHRGLAVLYFDLGALPQALMHLEKWAELDPQDGRSYRLMGLIHKDLKKYPEAITAYREALSRGLPGGNRDLNPDAVRKELADCLVEANKYVEALELLQEFEPLPEDVPQVEALRAECLWGLGRADEARAVLDQALDASSNCPELLRLRAKIHMADKESGAAIKLLQQALNLDPHDYVTRYQLAQVYESLNLKPQAAEQHRLAEQSRKDLEELSKLNREAVEKPTSAAVRARLAELCDRLGRPQDAEMWRQAAASLPPEPIPTSSQPSQDRSR